MEIYVLYPYIAKEGTSSQLAERGDDSNSSTSTGNRDHGSNVKHTFSRGQVI